LEAEVFGPTTTRQKPTKRFSLTDFRLENAVPDQAMTYPAHYKVYLLKISSPNPDSPHYALLVVGEEGSDIWRSEALTVEQYRQAVSALTSEKRAQMLEFLDCYPQSPSNMLVFEQEGLQAMGLTRSEKIRL
jgi:hypothetical protein